jgi:hypothetical protein
MQSQAQTKTQDEIVDDNFFQDAILKILQTNHLNGMKYSIANGINTCMQNLLKCNIIYYAPADKNVLGDKTYYHYNKWVYKNTKLETYKNRSKDRSNDFYENCYKYFYNSFSEDCLNGCLKGFPETIFNKINIKSFCTDYLITYGAFAHFLIPKQFLIEVYNNKLNKNILKHIKIQPAYMSDKINIGMKDIIPLIYDEGDLEENSKEDLCEYIVCHIKVDEEIYRSFNSMKNFDKHRAQIFCTEITDLLRNVHIQSNMDSIRLWNFNLSNYIYSAVDRALNLMNIRE